MNFKKSISALLTASLIITSIPVTSFAEEIKEKPSNPERWSFRNTYSNVVRKEDGTFPDGTTFQDPEKAPPKLYQNLVNLNPEAGGIQPNPSDPLYPKGEGKIIYQTPMFVDLPKDIAETVGPEDIEIYTIFSEPGENITGKLTLDELRSIYERSDTHKSTSASVDEYIGGNPADPILTPDRSRYSAKVINVSKPILYDKNHNVVPAGQKGGAYFTFTVNGPRETINPGPDSNNENASDPGYGLRIDDQKKREIVDYLKIFINAGVFESVQLKNGTIPNFDGKRPPSNPFTFEEINNNVTSAIKEWDIGGLFTGVDVDVKKLGHVLDGTSYALASQLMMIDANACVNAGGSREIYEQLGAFQSAWATSSPEEFVPYFNEVLTQNNNKANEAMTQAIKDKVQEFTDGISATGDKEKALHAFMKTLSGGSFIQFERDANGKLVTDPKTGKTKALRDKDGNYMLETDFDKAFANITKQGGVETSIFEVFKGDFEKIYQDLPGKSNQEVRALLMAKFEDYLKPGKQGGTKLSDMLSKIEYKSPLEMAQLDPTYRTFYPIAVKLKTGDNRLNLKATNISVKDIEEKYHYGGYKNRQKITDGYVYTLAISSTLDQGEYAGPIDNIIRIKNVYDGKDMGTVDAGTHDFSVNKNFYKEVTTPLIGTSGATFEYEVNPVKADGHHNPTEKGYLDNVVRTGDVNLTAAGLEVYVTNGGKTLNIDWEATKVGTFSGITDGEVVVKNINTGQVFLKENIAHVAFSYVDAGGDPYAKGSTTATINAPLQDLVVYFRVNYPNGYPGNKPVQETTFGDNEIMAYVIAGEIPPPPAIGTACEDMSDIETVSEVVYKIEWRGFDELTSGKVLKWQTKTYCASECPNQVTINPWYRNPNTTVGQESHVKYPSCNWHCHKYCKDGGCCRGDYRVTENKTALVQFMGKVTKNDVVLDNMRFPERKTIKAGYGVLLGGRFEMKTDYDKKLNPEIRIYRPKEGVSYDF